MRPQERVCPSTRGLTAAAQDARAPATTGSPTNCERTPDPSNPRLDDLDLLRTCVRDLEILAALDQTCNIHRIPLDTGARRIQGQRWRSHAGPPPAGGRTFRAPFTEPVIVTGGIVWEVFEQGRCDGDVHVVLRGPAGQDRIDLSLLYPERESTPGPVELTHAFDPSLLSPGVNRFLIRFVAIPGGAVGATTVTGLRVTLVD
ncbi:MAG: hypothetical protein HY814_13720 [Candidatus Riflebacteria bacterium]|nr:hypothetical protein [Candidatus Riflebacteria bacterium]